MLGNLEDLKDYHRHTLLPKLEDAVQDSQLIRCYQILRNCENWTEMLESKIYINSIYTGNNSIFIMI